MTDTGLGGRAQDSPRTARASTGDLDDLLVQVAGGDREAFAAVYDRLAPAVFGVARRVLRDPARAEEVAQDVLLEVWRGAARFDPGRGTASAWVLTIAHRRAVDRVRSETASVAREERVARQDLEREHDVVLDEVERRDEARAVRRCLDTLSDLQREAVSMAYYDGLSYPDVARRLGAPLGTVKSRLRDGLARLRSCLGGRS